MARRWRVGLPLLVLVLGLAELAAAAPPAARPTGSKWRGSTRDSRRRNRILRRPVQVEIGRPHDMPALTGAQATRALARIRAVRPEVPGGQLEAGFERYRAVTRRVRGASRASPGALRVSRAGSAAGLSILRVDLVGDRPVAGRRPRVLIVGGMHAGNETVGVEAATRFIEAAARDGDLRNRFDITVVPLANPTALVLGTRENADQLDANRSFADGQWTAESLAIRDIGDDFDLVVDLHGAGSRGRNGFFLIRGGEDGGMSARVLSAMQSGALMDPGGGTAIGPYRFDQLGGAVSVNQGTLTSWFSRLGTRHSYTLEAPLRLAPDRQVRGMLKLLRSTLFNVNRRGE
jgi:hypothetical protein